MSTPLITKIVATATQSICDTPSVNDISDARKKLNATTIGQKCTFVSPSLQGTSARIGHF